MKIDSNIKIVLLIAILVLLVVNFLVLNKSINAEWILYQKDYLKQEYDMAEDEKIRENLKTKSPEIKQLIIKGFGEERIDRCTSCHLAVDDKRFAEAEQPFKTHPPILEKHPHLKFGCTICHEGNGRGLSVHDAHGEDKHWISPLLTGDYTESSCARCHPFPYPEETAHLRNGADLFITKACYSCHKVEGISKGKLGVELTHIGEKLTLDYLKESIVDPKANNMESLMPKMNLSESELTDLLVYLKSLTGKNLKNGPVTYYTEIKKWLGEKNPEVEISAETGEELFKSKACTGCHKINGVGSDEAPDLSYVGIQRTKNWLIQHFIDPRSVVAGSIMPDFDLSESELESLTLYLMEQRGSSSTPDKPETK
ncbi:MAG: c-type cytochrome [Acidobacteriota bacterium]